MSKKFVAYYRVSTRKQNGDMPAQKTAVKNYLKNYYPPVKSFTEVESGGKSDRPELLKALAYCKQHKCNLVVAKLDRLSRDLAFIANLQKSNVEFVCADMPEANSLTISLLACLAQWEREQIAKRTKAGLAERKKAGVLLGSNNPRVARGLAKYRAMCAKKRANKKAKLLAKRKANKGKPLAVKFVSKRELADKQIIPHIRLLRDQGFSYEKVAQALNKLGHKTRWGKQWSQTQVILVAKRNKM